MRKDIERWITKQLPAPWLATTPEITIDGDEILIVISLTAASGKSSSAAVAAFRETSRDQRMKVAARAEERFGRRVSWGVRLGDERQYFTTASSPVMTRLRMPERAVLDTLIAAGVARTRSEALAWCVKLVGEHEGDWLRELQDALVHVEKVRAAGPSSRR